MTPPNLWKVQTTEDFYKPDFVEEENEEINYQFQNSKNYLTSTGQKVMVTLTPEAIPVVASKNNLFQKSFDDSFGANDRSEMSGSFNDRSQ